MPLISAMFAVGLGLAAVGLLSRCDAGRNAQADRTEHAELERQAKWGGRHGEMATECLALYWWWTEIRPRRGEEYFDMEDVYDAKDDEMLARLVKIRRWLWT